MDRHCIKYVLWENVQGWRQRVTAEGRSVEAAYPFAFGSRDPAMLGLTGDVLWLLTVPRYGHYRQAPSIVARLEIEHAGRDDGSERFARLDREVRDAGPNIVFARREADAYLPVNNAFLVLLGGLIPDLRDSSTASLGGPYAYVGRHFQGHRWVPESMVPSFERHASAVRRGRRVFLSYKRSDFPQMHGRSWPELLAAELQEREVSCWWDRWYLPQGADAGQADLGEDLLADLIGDAVRQSVWFVVLVGPRLAVAGEDSWPRREWMRAGIEMERSGRRHRLRRVAVLFDGVDPGPWSAERVVEVGASPDPAVVAGLLDSVMSAG